MTALLLLMLGCLTSPDRSKEALEKAGYSNIEIGGYDHWSCGDDDTYKTDFAADNPSGVRVEGVVCCGYWKGCTIRF